jgi:Flp pilus assembly protein TadD
MAASPWACVDRCRPTRGYTPGENVALKAFAHGNTCLAEGKFAEATAAFHQALKLEPTHPHIAGRLAEVDRRQKAASAMGLANSTV